MSFFFFLYPLRNFDDVWYANTSISGQGGLLHARMVAHPCCPFELSPLNELYREKLVGSISIIPFEIC